MTQQSTAAAAILAAAPPLPLTADQWQAVVKTLGLSKREAHIAELVLRDLGDKQIATVLGISHKTIETYLRDRIGKKAGTKGRMQFSMRVLAVALQACPCQEDS